MSETIDDMFKYLQKISLLYVTQHYRNDLEDSTLNLFQGYENLIQHQKFMALLYKNSNIKNVLVYQTVGSGKTISGISIINSVLNFINTDTYIYILAPKTIINDTWVVQLKTWLTNYNKSKMQVFFYSYDQQNSYYDLLSDFSKNKGKQNNNLFIVDEAHNITQQMFKIQKQEDVFVQYTQKGKEKLQKDKKLKIPNAAKFYVFLQELQNDQNNRLVLLSGTPIMKDPFEISLLLNLLHRDILPTDIQTFNSLYINPKNYSFMPGAKNSLARRMQMMIAFYKPKADVQQFAEKRALNVIYDMSDYQRKLYNLYRETENIQVKENDGKIRIKRGFRLPTMLASNFTIPNTKIFNPKLRIFENYSLQITQYFLQFIKSNDDIDMFYNEILIIKQIMVDTHNKNQGNITQKHIQKISELIMQCKSGILKQLYYHSIKYITIIFLMMMRKGPCIAYSQFVQQEGLETFIIYLQFFGFKDFSHQEEQGNTQTLNTDQIKKIWDCKEQCPKYAFYSGKQDTKDRTLTLNSTNDKANVDGDIIRITLVSKIAQEGISFQHIRQIFIIEPQTNYSKTEQIEARGIRFKSHLLLPENQRYVQVFRFVIKFIESNDTNQTEKKTEQCTDFNIYLKSKNQYELITGFLQLLRESSMDCSFYGDDCDTCFRLPDERYFDQNFQIYIQDYQYDLGVHQGTFSQGIQTIEQEAVYVDYINDQGKKKRGLMNPYNNIIYDEKYRIPILKIKTYNGFRIKDDQGNFIQQ